MTTTIEISRTLPSSKRIATDARRFSAATVKSGTVTATDQLPIADQILDGGELVLMAIKPSLWFVVFDAARWMIFGAMLLIVAMLPSVPIAGLSRRTLTQLGVAIVIIRLGAAFLRWVSRFYILTNRRVMRVRGVFNVDIKSCPLLSIRNTTVTVAPYERVTRLGTILFASDDVPCDDFHWFQINRVEEVHSRVRRAIERAIDEQPHI
ncbi:MAG: PH domain-containing protein [Planctomycetes bacterium]|nr:PH domain-containing protein [Planctomycetota bacterium]